MNANSHKDSMLVGQMLNILSKEYPVISKNLSKKFNNKRIPNKNKRKELKAIDLYENHPSIFQRITTRSIKTLLKRRKQTHYRSTRS